MIQYAVLKAETKRGQRDSVGTATAIAHFRKTTVHRKLCGVVYPESVARKSRSQRGTAWRQLIRYSFFAGERKGNDIFAIPAAKIGAPPRWTFGSLRDFRTYPPVEILINYRDLAHFLRPRGIARVSASDNGLPWPVLIWRGCVGISRQ